MNSVLPSISPQVSALAPGFRALSIDVVSAAVRAPWSGPMRSAPPARRFSPASRSGRRRTCRHGMSIPRLWRKT
jgi:hypothetical protein